MTSDPLLKLKNISTSYGESQVLRDLSMSIDHGEVVSLIGRNGVGKTTTLRSIMNIVTPHSGEIYFNGTDIVGQSIHTVTSKGVSYVPEERQIFPDLTVDENLQMGMVSAKQGLLTTEEVFDWFPRLQERREQRASSLSGGEQQMLAIARAILGDTDLLLLDEPTEGLAPKIVSDVVDIIENLREETNVTILLVEQDLQVALSVASHHHVMNKGKIVFNGTTDELKTADEIKRRHLSVGADSASVEE